jgi:hypothetical protein
MDESDKMERPEEVFLAFLKISAQDYLDILKKITKYVIKKPRHSEYKAAVLTS